MAVRDLPNNPSLEHLKHQARTLQREVRAGETDALALVREHHPRGGDATAPSHLAGFPLADAQLVVARRYGFASWPWLRTYLDTVARYARSPHRWSPGEAGKASDADSTTGLADELLRLACLNYGDDRPAHRDAARQLLAAHPELATASIHTMAAVGDVAAAAAALASDPSLARAEGGPHRWEPLLYACYSRLDSPRPGDSTLAVAQLLLAAGADPNAGYLWEGNYPFTALTGAFGGGEANQPAHPQWRELARLLLDSGGDPNDSQALYNRGGGKGPDGLAHIRLLLEYGLGHGSGGPWHARLGPEHHLSPAQLLQDELLQAAKQGDRELAQLMLDHGVEVDGLGSHHPTFGGYTAYELAVRNGHPEVAELLATGGATTTALTPVEAFVAACMRADRAEVDTLLATDPGLAAAAVAREPYLVGRAVEARRPDAVRLMVAFGFDVNNGDAMVFRGGGAAVMGLLSGLASQFNVIRRTAPLHLAAWRGDLEMARTLVELGADPSIRDCEHDSTPQGWAEYNHQDEVAAYLASLPSPAG